MKELIRKKWFKFAAGGALLIIIAVVLTVVLINCNKSFRVIKLEKYEGNVSVKRNDANIDLFGGLQLVSGDSSTTGDESIINLLIDSDKHMLVTANSRFDVTASGSEKSGKVQIELNEGRAFFEVDNKLSDNSSFEVITPNATTSIRGTKFATTYDSYDSSTTVFVDTGEVEVSYGASQTVNVKDKESVLIKDGNATIRKATTFKVTRHYNFTNTPYTDIPLLEITYIDENGDVKDASVITHVERMVSGVFDQHYDQMYAWYNDSIDPNSAEYHENITYWFPDRFVGDVGNGPEMFKIEKVLYDTAFKKRTYSVSDPSFYLDGIGFEFYVIDEGPADKELMDELGIPYEQEIVNPYAQYEIGDTFTFGTYESDGDESNGAEPIEWKVLDKSDGRLLVTSKYALDKMTFHDKEGGIIWENSFLRNWMNNEFLNTAFTEEEQAFIPTVSISNGSNPNTEDRIFCLSVDEVKEYITDESPSGKLKISPTEYCKKQGIKSANASWWLRSEGMAPHLASIVSIRGDCPAIAPADTIHAAGAGGAPTVDVAIRPALYIQYE